MLEVFENGIPERDRTMGYGLSESAVDAAKQWQFEPSLRDSKPVEVVQEVTIEFKP